MKRIIGFVAAAAFLVCPQPRSAVSGQEAAPGAPSPSDRTVTAPRVAAPQVPDSLTLEQAVRRVLETHPAVAEARNGVSASEARVQVQQSLFSPTVMAEGSYTRVGPTPTLTFNDETFSLFPANNYLAGVTLRHTLEDGGRRDMAVQHARSFERTATENVDLVRTRLAYQTIDAFYAVLFLRRNLQVQDEEIDALNQHLDIIQGKVQAGTATDFEALTTQVRIATARSQRVDIANALAQRSIELHDLLGLPTDRDIAPVGDFQADTLNLDVDSLRAAALEQRPDLRMARDAEASAEVGSRLAALADKPGVSLNLTVGAKNGFVPNINRIKPNFVAGMSVQLPVYQGDRTRSQVRAADADVTTARSHTTTLERGVTTAVEQSVAAVRAAQEKIQTTAVQVRQATAALELAKTRYQAGVVTNLDVLDAETVLAEARLVQLRARYDLTRSRYRLDQVVGAKVW